MKNIYSTLFEKGQHSFSLQSLMRTLLLCFVIAVATNGQAHEVDNIDYELRTDGTAWVEDGKKTQGDVTIPSKIEVDGKEYTVVGIDTNAFFYNTSITSVTLPDNLKYINGGAFSNCYNLENINNIPKHIEKLGEKGAVFSGTKFLTNGIKNEFFVFSDWLIKYTPQGETAKVTVPEGIFGISAYALTDADNTVVLPKSLRAASVLAFNSDLKNIDTGDNPRVRLQGRHTLSRRYGDLLQERTFAKRQSIGRWHVGGCHFKQCSEEWCPSDSWQGGNGRQRR